MAEFAKEDKKISVKFREYKVGDAPEIVNLIREEYGDSYQNKKLYDAEKINQLYAAGEVIFFVAEAEGEIAACLSLQKNSRDDYSNMATGIVAKAYRKYHLFQPMIKFVMDEIFQRRESSAICAVLVMYHEITEKLIDRLGLTPCGIIPQKVLVSQSHNSYATGKNLKYSSIFAVTKVLQEDAGKIYLPVEHKGFAEKIYQSLGAKFEINSDKKILSGASEIFVEDYPTHEYSAISIDSAGADLAEKILSIEKARQAPHQTFNIFLNISDDKAVAAYEILHGLGYFFAGLKPLGGKREIMILHNPKNVIIHFDELKATAHYLPLKNYVKQCYESR